jgi:hypothetical protein
VRVRGFGFGFGGSGSGSGRSTGTVFGESIDVIEQFINAVTIAVVVFWNGHAHRQGLSSYRRLFVPRFADDDSIYIRTQIDISCITEAAVKHMKRSITYKCT